MLYLVWKHWCLQMLDMTRASLKASILRCFPLACNKCRFLWNSFRPCSRHANLIEQHKKRSPFTFSHPSTTDPNIFQHLQLPALLGSLFLSSLRPRQLPLAHLPTQRAVTEAPSRGESVTGGFWKPLKWPYDHIYDDGRWWVHIYFTLDSSRLQIVSFGCNMCVHTVNDMLWQKCSHGIPWDREAQVLVILSSYSVYSLA